MRTITIINCDNGVTLAASVGVAETLGQRLKGLLGTDGLACGRGLLLKPCNSVHTIGMRYALDIVFLGDDFRVLKIVENLPPGRMTWCWRGKMALELPAGTVANTFTAAGHRLMEGQP